MYGHCLSFPAAWELKAVITPFHRWEGGGQSLHGMETHSTWQESETAGPVVHVQSEWHLGGWRPGPGAASVPLPVVGADLRTLALSSLPLPGPRPYLLADNLTSSHAKLSLSFLSFCLTNWNPWHASCMGGQGFTASLTVARREVSRALRHLAAGPSCHLLFPPTVLPESLSLFNPFLSLSGGGFARSGHQPSSRRQ